MSHYRAEKIFLTVAGLKKFKKELKRLKEARDSKEGEQEDLIRINKRIEELDLIFKSHELIKVPQKKQTAHCQFGSNRGGGSWRSN